MNQLLLLSGLFKRKGMMIVVATTIIYGIFWGLIYLIFSAFHGMTEMFNEEFIWFIAGILNIELNTTGDGFLFAFLDGSILGFLFGILLLKIYRKNDDKS